MATTVACERCGKRYDVAEQLLGQQVRCAQCGHAFVAQAAGPAPLPGGAYPSGPGAPPNWNALPAAPVASPVANLSDQQYRLGGLILMPIMLLGVAAAVFGDRGRSTAAVALAGLGPMFFCFALAAVIDPNLVRAATVHGKHLSLGYKLAAAAIGFAGLAIGLAVVWWLVFAG